MSAVERIESGTTQNAADSSTSSALPQWVSYSQTEPLKVPSLAEVRAPRLAATPITIAEAERRFGFDEKYVYALVELGLLTPVRLAGGRRTMYLDHELARCRELLDGGETMATLALRRRLGYWALNGALGYHITGRAA